MSLTPNYGFNIPTGTDTVNLLTQCYPNFSALDGYLKTIADTGVTVATATKVGTVFQLVRTNSDLMVIRFVATGNYNAGDTFTVDGVAVTATAVDGTSLQTGTFVINQSVLCILNGSVLTVYAGGSGANTAGDISYDNTGSGLTATNVQDAIDEVKADIPSIPATYAATSITYDNSGSGLTATNVQDAIDELASGTSSYVEVTADGLKTNQQLIYELYGLIDSSKINDKSYLTYDALTNKNVMQLTSTASGIYQFGRVFVTNSIVNGLGIDIRANQAQCAYTASSTSTSSTSFTSYNNTTPASGCKIRITY